MFKDTTSINLSKMRETQEVDDIRQIIGLAKRIQRKAQAMGAIGKRRWKRENVSSIYLSREVDCIYSACTRVLKEFGS